MKQAIQLKTNLIRVARIFYVHTRARVRSAAVNFNMSRLASARKLFASSTGNTRA